MRRFVLIASLSLLATTAASTPPAAHNQIGVDVAGIDRTVAPGDGFDRYANGAWRAHAEMPADRTRIGSFINLGDVIDGRNREIIAGAARANPAAGTDQRRIADYLCRLSRSGRHRSRAASRRCSRSSPRINAIQNRRDLSAALGGTLRADVDPLNATNFFTENLFGLFVSQGLETPDRTVPYLLQGGLGMPDRDYYLSDAPDMVRIRTAYRDLYRRHAEPDGRAGRAGAGRPHLRSGDEDRQRPGRRGRRAGSGQGRSVEPRRFRAPRTGHRLGRLFRSRAARQSAAIHGLASGPDREPFGSGRQRADRRLEGLARLPHRKPHGRGPAARL